MKLNVAEREGKGDKGISGEQEARGAREEAPLPVPSPSRAVSLPNSFPLLPFERLPSRLYQKRVLSRLLLPNDRYDVCRRIQSYLIKTKTIKYNATSASSKCAIYLPCKLLARSVKNAALLAINDRFTKLNSTG